MDYDEDFVDSQDSWTTDKLTRAHLLRLQNAWQQSAEEARMGKLTIDSLQSEVLRLREELFTYQRSDRTKEIELDMAEKFALQPENPYTLLQTVKSRLPKEATGRWIVGAAAKSGDSWVALSTASKHQEEMIFGNTLLDNYLRFQTAKDTQKSIEMTSTGEDDHLVLLDELSRMLPTNVVRYFLNGEIDGDILDGNEIESDDEDNVAFSSVYLTQKHHRIRTAAPVLVLGSSSSAPQRCVLLISFLTNDSTMKSGQNVLQQFLATYLNQQSTFFYPSFSNSLSATDSKYQLNWFHVFDQLRQLYVASIVKMLENRSEITISLHNSVKRCIDGAVASFVSDTTMSDKCAEVLQHVDKLLIEAVNVEGDDDASGDESSDDFGRGNSSNQVDVACNFVFAREPVYFRPGSRTSDSSRDSWPSVWLSQANDTQLKYLSSHNLPSVNDNGGTTSASIYYDNSSYESMEQAEHAAVALCLQTAGTSQQQLRGRQTTPTSALAVVTSFVQVLLSSPTIPKKAPKSRKEARSPTNKKKRPTGDNLRGSLSPSKHEKDMIHQRQGQHGEGDFQDEAEEQEERIRRRHICYLAVPLHNFSSKDSSQREHLIGCWLIRLTSAFQVTLTTSGKSQVPTAHQLLPRSQWTRLVSTLGSSDVANAVWSWLHGANFVPLSLFRMPSSLDQHGIGSATAEMKTEAEMVGKTVAQLADLLDASPLIPAAKAGDGSSESETNKALAIADAVHHLQHILHCDTVSLLHVQQSSIGRIVATLDSEDSGFNSHAEEAFVQVVDAAGRITPCVWGQLPIYVQHEGATALQQAVQLHASAPSQKLNKVSHASRRTTGGHADADGFSGGVHSVAIVTDENEDSESFEKSREGKARHHKKKQVFATNHWLQQDLASFLSLCHFSSVQAMHSTADYSTAHVFQFGSWNTPGSDDHTQQATSMQKAAQIYQTLSDTRLQTISSEGFFQTLLLLVALPTSSFNKPLSVANVDNTDDGDEDDAEDTADKQWLLISCGRFMRQPDLATSTHSNTVLTNLFHQVGQTLRHRWQARRLRVQQRAILALEASRVRTESFRRGLHSLERALLSHKTDVDISNHSKGARSILTIGDARRLLVDVLQRYLQEEMTDALSCIDLDTTSVGKGSKQEIIKAAQCEISLSLIQTHSVFHPNSAVGYGQQHVGSKPSLIGGQWDSVETRWRLSSSSSSTAGAGGDFDWHRSSAHLQSTSSHAITTGVFPLGQSTGISVKKTFSIDVYCEDLTTVSSTVSALSSSTSTGTKATCESLPRSVLQVEVHFLPPTVSTPESALSNNVGANSRSTKSQASTAFFAALVDQVWQRFTSSLSCAAWKEEVQRFVQLHAMLVMQRQASALCNDQRANATASEFSSSSAEETCFQYALQAMHAVMLSTHHQATRNSVLNSSEGGKSTNSDANSTHGRSSFSLHDYLTDVALLQRLVLHPALDSVFIVPIKRFRGIDTASNSYGDTGGLAKTYEYFSSEDSDDLDSEGQGAVDDIGFSGGGGDDSNVGEKEEISFAQSLSLDAAAVRAQQSTLLLEQMLPLPKRVNRAISAILSVGTVLASASAGSAIAAPSVGGSIVHRSPSSQLAVLSYEAARALIHHLHDLDQQLGENLLLLTLGDEKLAQFSSHNTSSKKEGHHYTDKELPDTTNLPLLQRLLQVENCSVLLYSPLYPSQEEQGQDKSIKIKSPDTGSSTTMADWATHYMLITRADRVSTASSLLHVQSCLDAVYRPSVTIAAGQSWFEVISGMERLLLASTSLTAMVQSTNGNANDLVVANSNGKNTAAARRRSTMRTFALEHDQSAAGSSNIGSKKSGVTNRQQSDMVKKLVSRRSFLHFQIEEEAPTQVSNQSDVGLFTGAESAAEVCFLEANNLLMETLVVLKGALSSSAAYIAAAGYVLRPQDLESCIFQRYHKGAAHNNKGSGVDPSLMMLQRSFCDDTHEATAQLLCPRAAQDIARWFHRSRTQGDIRDPQSMTRGIEGETDGVAMTFQHFLYSAKKNLSSTGRSNVGIGRTASGQPRKTTSSNDLQSLEPQLHFVEVSSADFSTALRAMSSVSTSVSNEFSSSSKSSSIETAGFLLRNDIKIWILYITAHLPLVTAAGSSRNAVSVEACDDMVVAALVVYLADSASSVASSKGGQASHSDTYTSESEDEEEEVSSYQPYSSGGGRRRADTNDSDSDGVHAFDDKSDLFGSITSHSASFRPFSGPLTNSAGVSKKMAPSNKTSSPLTRQASRRGSALQYAAPARGNASPPKPNPTPGVSRRVSFTATIASGLAQQQQQQETAHQHNQNQHRQSVHVVSRPLTLMQRLLGPALYRGVSRVLDVSAALLSALYVRRAAEILHEQQMTVQLHRVTEERDTIIQKLLQLHNDVAAVPRGPNNTGSVSTAANTAFNAIGGSGNGGRSPAAMLLGHTPTSPSSSVSTAVANMPRSRGQRQQLLLDFGNAVEHLVEDHGTLRHNHRHAESNMTAMKQRLQEAFDGKDTLARRHQDYRKMVRALCHLYAPLLLSSHQSSEEAGEAEELGTLASLVVTLKYSLAAHVVSQQHASQQHHHRSATLALIDRLRAFIMHLQRLPVPPAQNMQMVDFQQKLWQLAAIHCKQPLLPTMIPNGTGHQLGGSSSTQMLLQKHALLQREEIDDLLGVEDGTEGGDDASFGGRFVDLELAVFWLDSLRLLGTLPQQFSVQQATPPQQRSKKSVTIQDHRGKNSSDDDEEESDDEEEIVTYDDDDNDRPPPPRRSSSLSTPKRPEATFVDELASCCVPGSDLRLFPGSPGLFLSSARQAVAEEKVVHIRGSKIYQNFSQQSTSNAGSKKRPTSKGATNAYEVDQAHCVLLDTLRQQGVVIADVFLIPVFYDAVTTTGLATGDKVEADDGPVASKKVVALVQRVFFHAPHEVRQGQGSSTSPSLSSGNRMRADTGDHIDVQYDVQADILLQRMIGTVIRPLLSAYHRSSSLVTDQLDESGQQAEEMQRFWHSMMQMLPIETSISSSTTSAPSEKGSLARTSSLLSIKSMSSSSSAASSRRPGHDLFDLLGVHLSDAFCLQVACCASSLLPEACAAFFPLSNATENWATETAKGLHIFSARHGHPLVSSSSVSSFSSAAGPKNGLFDQLALTTLTKTLQQMSRGSDRDFAVRVLPRRLFLADGGHGSSSSNSVNGTVMSLPWHLIVALIPLQAPPTSSPASSSSAATRLPRFCVLALEIDRAVSTVDAQAVKFLSHLVDNHLHVHFQQATSTLKDTQLRSLAGSLAESSRSLVSQQQETVLVVNVWQRLRDLQSFSDIPLDECISSGASSSASPGARRTKHVTYHVDQSASSTEENLFAAQCFLPQRLRNWLQTQEDLSAVFAACTQSNSSSSQQQQHRGQNQNTVHLNIHACGLLSTDVKQSSDSASAPTNPAEYSLGDVLGQLALRTSALSVLFDHVQYTTESSTHIAPSAQRMQAVMLLAVQRKRVVLDDVPTTSSSLSASTSSGGTTVAAVVYVPLLCGRRDCLSLTGLTEQHDDTEEDEENQFLSTIVAHYFSQRKQSSVSSTTSLTASDCCATAWVLSLSFHSLLDAERFLTNMLLAPVDATSMMNSHNAFLHSGSMAPNVPGTENTSGKNHGNGNTGNSYQNLSNLALIAQHTLSTLTATLRHQLGQFRGRLQRHGETWKQKMQSSFVSTMLSVQNAVQQTRNSDPSLENDQMTTEDIQSSLEKVEYHLANSIERQVNSSKQSNPDSNSKSSIVSSASEGMASLLVVLETRLHWHVPASSTPAIHDMDEVNRESSPWMSTAYRHTNPNEERRTRQKQELWLDLGLQQWLEAKADSVLLGSSSSSNKSGNRRSAPPSRKQTQQQPQHQRVDPQLGLKGLVYANAGVVVVASKMSAAALSYESDDDEGGTGGNIAMAATTVYHIYVTSAMASGAASMEGGGLPSADACVLEVVVVAGMQIEDSFLQALLRHQLAQIVLQQPQSESSILQTVQHTLRVHFLLQSHQRKLQLRANHQIAQTQLLMAQHQGLLSHAMALFASEGNSAKQLLQRVHLAILHFLAPLGATAVQMWIEDESLVNAQHNNKEVDASARHPMLYEDHVTLDNAALKSYPQTPYPASSTIPQPFDAFSPLPAPSATGTASILQVATAKSPSPQRTASRISAFSPMPPPRTPAAFHPNQLHLQQQEVQTVQIENRFTYHEIQGAFVVTFVLSSTSTWLSSSLGDGSDQQPLPLSSPWPLVQALCTTPAARSHADKTSSTGLFSPSNSSHQKNISFQQFTSVLESGGSNAVRSDSASYGGKTATSSRSTGSEVVLETIARTLARRVFELNRGQKNKRLLGEKHKQLHEVKEVLHERAQQVSSLTLSQSDYAQALQAQEEDTKRVRVLAEKDISSLKEALKNKSDSLAHLKVRVFLTKVFKYALY